MLKVRCSSCEIYAYDTTAPLFGSAHLMVRDDECSYFVAGGEYMLTAPRLPRDPSERA
jgi:hypothetical protein